MADYTYNDMLRMQEEAAERVRAMKKRAALAMDDAVETRRNIPLPDDVRHYSLPVEYENKQSEKPHPSAVKTEKHHSAGRITGDKDILIIDLASVPGGVDFAAAKDKGIEAVWALSLPGKYAPESAGAIIADVLDELFESEGLI